MNVTELQSLYNEIFAPWVRELDLVVRSTSVDSVTLALPVQPRHVQGGGVVCGQTLMAAADTALVLAISHKLGGFRPQTTVQLQASFMRPVGKEVDAVTVTAPATSSRAPLGAT